MHELSLAMEMVNQVQAVLRRESANQVLKIRLVMGTLSGVEREPFEFCFPMVSRGTPLEGATLEIEEERFRLICRKCGAESQPDHPIMGCAECGANDVTVVGGRDFTIQSLEVQ